MGRVEEQIVEAERAAGAGDATPALLFRLGQLYLRADRAGEACEALERALEVMGGATVHSADGQIDVDPLWDELQDALARARPLRAGHERRARRRALVTRLESAGRLDPAEHDVLIRLEVQDGVGVHAEVPACPACQGPVTRKPDGTIACARSGEDGDLCRHTGARGLYACEGCGLVVRLWRERTLQVDSREPPLVRPERSVCKHCGGKVANWRNHFLRCPKARPADFPVCPVCKKRGFHAGALRCPRCEGQVADTLCAQKQSWR